MKYSSSTLFLIVFFLPIIYSCDSPEADNHTELVVKLPFKGEGIDVKAEVVKRGLFYKEIVSNGQLSPVKKAKLIFKINENVLEIFVKNGQWVRAGEILAKLDAHNQVLDLDKAKNQLVKAEIELKNILLAHSPNLSDTFKMNDRVLEAAKSRSGYNEAVFSMKEAEYNLTQTNIRAPFEGIISNLHVKENNPAGNNEVFAYVIDNRQMEVVFGIMESELETVNINSKVIVSPFAFPNKKYIGKINEINPMIDPSGMIQAKALITNSDNVLLDGMNVEVIVRKEIPDQIVVSKESVLLRQGKQVVFTLKKDSIAQWVYVQTGMVNESHCIIATGIKEGDTILVNNNFNLGHGSIVKAQIISK